MANITCPYCGRDAYFEYHHETLRFGRFADRTDVWAGLSECPSCKGVVAIAYPGPGNDNALEHLPNATARQPNALIPAPVREDLYEARKCMTVSSYKAAAAMCRRALQGACIDRGATAKTLQKQIEEVVAANQVHASLKDWADTIRLIGNTGAHPGEDGLEIVTKEEAEDIVAFAEQFLDLTYVVAARVQQRLAARTT